MAHLVEGEWKDFTFRMLTPTDFTDVTEHLRKNFMLDGPIVRAVFGCSWIDPNSDKMEDERTFSASLCDCLEEALSFAAYDKQSGRIAGVRLISRQIKGNNQPSGFTQASTSIKAKIVARFFDQVDAASDIFDLFQVDRYAELRVASVDKEFRRQGLATEMYRRAIAFLKESGEFEVAKGIFGSPYSRAAALKFGFEELSRHHLRELEDLDGTRICPDTDAFAAVMILKI